MTRSYPTFLLLAAICFGAEAAFPAEKAVLVPLGALYAGERTGPLKHPEGVACRGKQVVIADTGNGRLLRYTLAGGILTGGSPAITAQLKHPTRVEIGPQGNVLVLDSKPVRIVRFSAEGEFRETVKPTGLPASASTVVPQSFALDTEGHIYVLDAFGQRVLKLAADGSCKDIIALPASDGFFSDIAVNDKGTVFVLDSVRASVFAATEPAAGFVFNQDIEYSGFWHIWNIL